MERVDSGLIQVPEHIKKNADKVGVMTKQGGVWKTWKRRYFVLKDNHLYYFALPSDSVPKGVIDLESAQVEEAESQTGKKFCFLVKAKKSWTGSEAWGDRAYFFQTESSEEMSSWMQFFRVAASKSSKRDSAVQPPSPTSKPTQQRPSKYSTESVEVPQQQQQSSPDTNRYSMSQGADVLAQAQTHEEVGIGSFEIDSKGCITFIIALDRTRFDHIKKLTKIHFVSLIGILNQAQRPQIRIDIPDVNVTIGVIGPFSEDEQKKLDEAQRTSRTVGISIKEIHGSELVDLSSKTGHGLVLDFSGQLSRAITYPHDNPNKEPLLRDLINQAEEQQQPVPTGAYYELGRLYMAKAASDLALECLEKEIKALTQGSQINPHASFPLNSKAVMLKRTGKIDLAKETFEKALLLRPNYFEALITYSTILASSPMTMNIAFELVSRAIILQPESPIFAQLLPQYVKIFSQESESSLRKRLQEQGKKIDLSKPSVSVGPSTK